MTVTNLVPIPGGRIQQNIRAVQRIQWAEQWGPHNCDLRVDWHDGGLFGDCETGVPGASNAELSAVGMGYAFWFTLLEGEWISAVDMIPYRQAILDGMTGNSSLIAGWDARVMPAQATSAVSRRSATELRVFIEYDGLYANAPGNSETITFSLPEGITVGGDAPLIASQFKIQLTAPAVISFKILPHTVWVDDARTTVSRTWTDCRSLTSFYGHPSAVTVDYLNDNYGGMEMEQFLNGKFLAPGSFATVWDWNDYPGVLHNITTGNDPRYMSPLGVAVPSAGYFPHDDTYYRSGNTIPSFDPDYPHKQPLSNPGGPFKRYGYEPTTSTYYIYYAGDLDDVALAHPDLRFFDYYPPNYEPVWPPMNPP